MARTYTAGRTLSRSGPQRAARSASSKRGQHVVGELGTTGLIVHHVPVRGVAVAGREPDVASTDLAEFARPSLQERAFERVEFLSRRKGQSKLQVGLVRSSVPIPCTART